MQKLSKFLAFFLLLFLFPVSVNAQIPKLKYPCDSPGLDPEFHSLRPYQAAPCGDAVKALYCSNDLIFTEDFDMTNEGLCTPKKKTGSFTCDPQYYVDPHNLYVQLDDSFLPIMGNTEDEFDDAQKVNEYASWYLSGVNNRAEYGENTDERVVNFSGPIQKLLPKMIQEAERIETIKKATLNDTEWTDEDTGEVFDTPQNHDQIVVCANGNNAVPCPEGSELRLSSWGEGSLSAINTFFNWLGTDIWNHKYPPLPWQFDKQILYQKAYSEWQGKNCAILPIIGLQCLDTPVSDKWADLYQYIPLSNTTDKKGAEYIKDKPQYIPSPGTEIGPVLTGKIKIPPLYFAHMQEVKDLSELLNKSYTPKDVESVPLPETTEDNNCSVATVRTNKGDDLFPGDENELLIPNVEYDITQATCNEVYEIIQNTCQGPTGPPYSCPEIIQSFDCPAQVVIKIPTGTKSPWANEIFSTTVADSGSTFRKIFPKVEEGAPVSCIADIPTITDVTYDPDIGGKSQKPRGGDLNFDVYRYPEDGAGDSRQLTFPHIGSVYEYFLKGIQTALRPKGYGEPITDGVLCKPKDDTVCGEWESKLKGSGGACGICGSPIGNLAKRILTTAGTAYNVPAANIWAAMKHEGADGYQGTTYDFSDENVRKWSNSEACGGEPMPGCDNSIESTQPPFGFLSYWFYLGDGDNAIWKAVQKIDPTRDSKDKVSRCNFLDTAFGAAKTLNQGASNTTAGLSCGTYSGFDTTSPGTCSSAFWTDTKVAQSQNGYAGLCVNDLPTPLYTLETAVSWYKDAKCQ